MNPDKYLGIMMRNKHSASITQDGTRISDDSKVYHGIFKTERRRRIKSLKIF